MRRVSLAVLLCTLLGLPSVATAQMDLVVSVEGWPRIGTRADGKLEVLSYSLVVPQTVGSGTTRAKAQQLNITLRQEPGAYFSRAALRGEVLKTVLLEAFGGKTTKPPPRAPFAIRFSDVRVASVQFGGSEFNDREIAYVLLEASRIEIFTATMDPTGAMKPGLQFGWDYKVGKPPASP